MTRGTNQVKWTKYLGWCKGQIVDVRLLAEWNKWATPFKTSNEQLLYLSITLEVTPLDLDNIIAEITIQALRAPGK